MQLVEVKHLIAVSSCGKDLNGSDISRADVASLMLEQLEDDTYLHRFPALAY